MSPFETAALSAFVGATPVLLIVILAWIDVKSKISDMNRDREDLKRELTRQMIENRNFFNNELLRVEEVLDSRLRRLEES